MRGRITVWLSLASLILGLGGAVLAAYPIIFPFRGQELVNLSADTVTPGKTPAFEAWQARSDKLGRIGLFFVALGTAAAALAQM